MEAAGPDSVTVALVHGAFADASSWSRVVRALQAAGVPTTALVNPLRGLTADGEYVAGALSQIEGDVVLVGHSYGGPVATYASSKAANVKALVLVASFGLDEGMSALGSVESFPATQLNTALLPRTHPTGDDSTATEFYIRPEQFHSVFCADLPGDDAAVLAVSQRPGSELAFFEPLAVEPGWKKVPSWFVVAGADNAIHPDSERAAAERMGATTVEIEGGSHAIALSHPDRVCAVILDAVRHTARA
jgi:pimeloyl-ACP methyl ester carboxylesterase